MHESHSCGMQRLPRKRYREVAVAARLVHRAAHERMADRMKMHAYLMGAPRRQAAFQKGCLGKSLQNAVAGERRLTGGHDRHSRSHSRIAADRCFYAAILGDRSMNERAVHPFHCTRPKLAD